MSGVRGKGGQGTVGLRCCSSVLEVRGGRGFNGRVK